MFGSVTVFAQNMLFLRESPIAWLDDDDEVILKDTLDQVILAPDGTSKEWENPETGSTGRLQVLDTHEDFGTTCRHIRMLNEAAGRRGGGIYRLCLSEDGNWRFAPNAENPPSEAATDDSDSPSQDPG